MVFAPKFWAHGGDLQRSFVAMWMEIGWGLYFQVLPSRSQLPHLQSLAPTEAVGTPKHSITYPYPPLAIGSEEEQGEPDESEGSEREQDGSKGSKQVAHWLAPSCSPHSHSLPLAPLAPSRSPRSPTSHLVKLSLPDIFLFTMLHFVSSQ